MTRDCNDIADSSPSKLTSASKNVAPNQYLLPSRLVRSIGSPVDSDRDTSPVGRDPNPENKISSEDGNENDSTRSDPSINREYDTAIVASDVVTKSNSGIDFSSDSIRVAVRVRPFLPFEAGNHSVVQIPLGMPNSIQLSNGDESYNQNSQTFTFDEAFNSESGQLHVYKLAVAPLVQACLEGYNATILAYGQTGSGKTHTILGNAHDHISFDSSDISVDAGIIPRAFQDIFACLNSNKKKCGFEYSVKIQLLEIYGDDIRDLLGSGENQKLQIREVGADKEAEVPGCMDVMVADANEALLCVARGTLRRVTRATAMNSASSRSHAIITLTIEQHFANTDTVLSSSQGNGGQDITTKRSKFRFVDLAGSERAKRTKAKGQGFKEGVHINQGLLVLGQVISALATSSDAVSRASNTIGQGTHGNTNKHIPYRDSKLTRLLRGSLGGNHKTLLIACISPSSSNIEESLNTLRYANRAKNIKNDAVLNVNESASTKVIQELNDQVQLLAHEVLRLRSLFVDPSSGVSKTQVDGEIFTHEILLALAAGGGNSSNGVFDLIRTNLENRELSNVRSITNDRTSSTPSSGQLEAALAEIATLRSALEESNEKCFDLEQQLDWIRDELKSRDNGMNLSNISNLSDLDDGEMDDIDDRVSVVTIPTLSASFGNGRLSRETFETIKVVYEEKLAHLAEQIIHLENERDNLSMQLCRHESDLKRFEYVKASFIKDLEQKDMKIAAAKAYLDELKKITVIPDSDPSAGKSGRRLRIWGHGNNAAHSSAQPSSTMTSYYSEKLLKIEKHIRTREDEVNNLAVELRKLEADSQIFTDLEKDLGKRLTKKEKSIEELKENMRSANLSPDHLATLNIVLAKEQEERDRLMHELSSLQMDGKTFQDLFAALSEDRATKEAHLEKYKKKHRDLAKSVGLPSPYRDNTNGPNDDDDAGDDHSIDSVMTFSSLDTVLSYSGATIPKADLDQKVVATERDIAKYEEEKELIIADLARIDEDAASFNALSKNLKEKLKLRGDQIDKLKKNETNFKETLEKQRKELETLLDTHMGSELDLCTVDLR